MRRFSKLILCGALTLLPIFAHAEVVSSVPSGFVVKTEAVVGVSPDSLYATLVQHVSEWWDPDHTFSGDAANLTLEAKPGGCFCEALPDGGGVRHLQVVYASPGKLLRMSGGLGPLQGSGLSGSLTFSFEAQGDSTLARMQYAVGGYMEGGLEKIAPVVDGVLHGQFMRLKAFAETGHAVSR
jgi:hypothetical protein